MFIISVKRIRLVKLVLLHKFNSPENPTCRGVALTSARKKEMRTGHEEKKKQVIIKYFCELEQTDIKPVNEV